jgi:hypothetical protein
VILGKFHVLIGSLIEVLPQRPVLLDDLLVLLLHFSLQEVNGRELHYLVGRVLRGILLGIPGLDFVLLAAIGKDLGLLSLELLIKELLLLPILLNHGFLLHVPIEGSLRECIMVEIELLQLLWGRGQDVLPVQPANEVRVLVEPVLLQELVHDHPSGWQAVKAVVLIVLIPELVNADDLPADGLILLFDVPLTPFGTLACYGEYGTLQLEEKLSFKLVH